MYIRTLKRYKIWGSIFLKHEIDNLHPCETHFSFNLIVKTDEPLELHMWNEAGKEVVGLPIYDIQNIIYMWKQKFTQQEKAFGSA